MFDLVLWPSLRLNFLTNICLLESDLKMSKAHDNEVSFGENVSYLSTSMNLYERNEQFFMTKTAIDLTGQTLAPLYSINLKLAGLCWSANPSYCYKYNTLCAALQ